MGLLWTVIARAGQGGFMNLGGEGSCKALKGNVHSGIDCAARQLEYFIQLKRSHAGVLKFHFFVLTMLPKAQYFPLS